MQQKTMVFKSIVENFKSHKIKEIQFLVSSIDLLSQVAPSPNHWQRTLMPQEHKQTSTIHYHLYWYSFKVSYIL